jgi:addiction module HigA family antidote
MSNETVYPDKITLPGETVRESLEVLGLTQADLARRMGRPPKTINEIIKGKAAITPDTAIELEKALGAPASFWNSLERRYREVLAHNKARSAYEKQVPLLSQYPYDELAKHGLVRRLVDPVGRVSELLRFFGAADLQTVPSLMPAAFRTAKCRKASPGSCAAWVRIAEMNASKVSLAPFNRRKWLDTLMRIREYTCEPAEVFQEKMVRSCAGSGVAVVFFPHLEKTYANGVAKWIDKDHALIQLSIRGRLSDIFWFSFYHEAAHILLHSKRQTFIDGDFRKDALEREADRCAADLLIPQKAYMGFKSAGDYSEKAIKGFSRTLGVAPCMVIGRLAHDEIVAHSYLRHLRPKLEWSANSQTGHQQEAAA